MDELTLRALADIWLAETQRLPCGLPSLVYELPANKKAGEPRVLLETYRKKEAL